MRRRLYNILCENADTIAYLALSAVLAAVLFSAR